MTSTIEKTFIQELLEEGVRQDGRKLDHARPFELFLGTDYGSVEVRHGGTRLAVQVSASVKKPRESRPFEGLFHITTEVTSMASPRFENGRQGPDELVLGRVVEKAIRRSNALDLESLCIVAGKSCWMIRADVHYLDCDGGLVDTTCVGVIAALLYFRRPDTTIDGDHVIIHSIHERPPVPLSVLFVPVCVTWSLYANDILLLDATTAEEELELGDMIITVTKDREVCQLSKTGGPALAPATIVECSEKAHIIAKEVTAMIYRRLREDDAMRNKGNQGIDLAANDR